MLSSALLTTLTLTLLTTTASAQCVTPGYVLCSPAGSNLGGVPSSSFDDSGFWDSLQSVASLPIGKRTPFNSAKQRRSLAARQDALCCRPDPDVYCLLITDGNIPFCYDSTTTRYVFSDESYGYLDNGTYYAADGTFVDFQDGTYSLTDGETGSFAAATSFASAAASDTPTQTVPGTGPATKVAAGGGSGGSGSGGTSGTTSAPASGSSSGAKSGSGSSSGSGSNSGSSSSGKNEGGRVELVGLWAVLGLVGVLATFVML